MYNTSVAVTALHREVELPTQPIAGSFSKVEIDALFYQPFNTASAVPHSEFHRLALAQPGPGGQGVGHMRINGISVVENCSHAALRPKG